ncbi:MAG: alpha/beta hydrolase [Marinilabiliaceae bacterium]|nr:alpha/beta hydrolase [Marinilabiliaceae bacterium]
MRKILLFSFLLINWGVMFSQFEKINIWEGKAPFNKDVTVEEQDVNNRVSKVTVPQLYHYSIKSDSLKPAIIVIPGGGYVREAINHEGYMAAEWFNKQGFEAFVLKYRLPDEEIVDNSSFVPLMDAQEAIRIVRKRAAEWHIDTARIGVIGFSAGGHLAASVSTLFIKPVNSKNNSADVRPGFSILMYPVISMDDACTHKGSRENLLGEHPDVSMLEQFSLEKQVSSKTPVTLMVHAIDDRAVPVENTDRYAVSIIKSGGDVTKVILPQGGHGFGFDSKRPVAYWTQYLEVWLKNHIIK